MKRQKGVDRRMKLNRTTQRTIEILELISQNPEGASLDELCDRLELPKTSAYDIVTTLEALGMVQISWGQKKRYTIGLTAYRIGINYTNNLNIMNIMEPELKKFAHEIGKTVFFGVRSDIEVVYICKFEPENPIITTATVGSRIPMYCTSLGKAILAYSEPEILQPLLKRMTFVKRTEHTITDLDRLMQELMQVREQGYALDAREMEEHAECVGAPVFGADGGLVGAVSVSTLYREAVNYEELGMLVLKKAKQLSEMLGYIRQ